MTDVKRCCGNCQHVRIIQKHRTDYRDVTCMWKYSEPVMPPWLTRTIHVFMEHVVSEHTPTDCPCFQPKEKETP